MKSFLFPVSGGEVFALDAAAAADGPAAFGVAAAVAVGAVFAARGPDWSRSAPDVDVDVLLRPLPIAAPVELDAMLLGRSVSGFPADGLSEDGFAAADEPSDRVALATAAAAPVDLAFAAVALIPDGVPTDPERTGEPVDVLPGPPL